MVDGQTLMDLILQRQSARKYSNKPVESDKLERITEAGRMSPSACNSQPWKFIVVTDPVILSKLSEAATEKLTGMNSFISQAPAQLIIVRENPNFSSRFGSAVKQKDYSRIDIGIAAENICLQATAEGLGSCMIGWFNERLIKDILGIPSRKRVELIITIGYSTAEYRTKKRKPKEVTISYNKY